MEAKTKDLAHRRERLHRLVDDMNEGELDTVETFVEFVHERGDMDHLDDGSNAQQDIAGFAERPARQDGERRSQLLAPVAADVGEQALEFGLIRRQRLRHDCRHPLQLVLDQACHVF